MRLFHEQDNLWKYAMDSRIYPAAIRAYDMAFIIGQKSYEGFDYYDFFEQVFERLKGHPFQSNLSSDSEVSTHEEWLTKCIIYTFTFILLKRKISDTIVLFLFFQVSPYAAYLHDAVLLYAMGLKEVLKDGRDPYDGREVLQRLKKTSNIRFNGWYLWRSLFSTCQQSTKRFCLVSVCAC